MPLEELLTDRRAAIVDRWAEMALGVYPPGAAPFLRGERDRFRNPVGHITGECLAGLFDGLVAGRPPAELRSELDGIVRIRAVQDLSPSRALGFLFLLETAIRTELGAGAEDEDARAALHRMNRWIHALVLEAFDLYVRCREQIYDLRARDVQRRTSRLLERLQERGTGERKRDAHPAARDAVDGGTGG